MTTAEMVAEAMRRLNREEDDDLFDHPSEYEWAINKAHNYFLRHVSLHAPEAIYQDLTIDAPDTTPQDNGNAIYTLSSDPLGQMLVFEDPGPPGGRLLQPTRPEVPGDYWRQGRKIFFQYARGTSQSIRVKWVPWPSKKLTQGRPRTNSPPAESDAVDAVNPNSTGSSNLPEYMHEAIVDYAAFLMAEKPGFMGNPMVFHEAALRHWRGDPNDQSDAGVLGMLKKIESQPGVSSVNLTYGGDDGLLI